MNEKSPDAGATENAKMRPDQAEDEKLRTPADARDHYQASQRAALRPSDATTCSALRFSTVDELREHIEGRWALEKCPRCQARLLTNNAGDKWCSYAHCNYGTEENGPIPCVRCGHLNSITNGHCYHCATMNAKCPDCGGDTFRDESRITWCHECGWNHSPQNIQAMASADTNLNQHQEPK